MKNLPPLETKNAPDDDDFSDALDTLTKAVTDGQTALETKVAKLISDAIKPLDDALRDIEKKANRPSIFGTDGFEVKADEAELQKALANFARRGDETELKSMSVGSDPDGGYTVHPVLSQTIRKKLFDENPMRRIAHVETITSGDSWEEPTDDDDLGAGWVGETEGRPETLTAQVGMLNIPVQEVYAMPKVTQRLLDDSTYNIGLWLENKIGEKFGRMEGQAGVLGNGIKKPRGILTYPQSALPDTARDRSTLQFLVSGNATEMTPSVLKTLTWTLRAPYRKNASWLMNSQTASKIDLFKDGNGQFIWRTGMTAGAPSTLLGYPVEIDETMPDVAAGSTPIAFGDFKQGYIFVDKPGIKMLRDPYTQKPNVLFYAYRRTGGGLRNAEAIKLLKIAA